MPSEPPPRLRGWDEIAAYLRVDKKTAQRYAKFKGLPVTRPAGPHATVVADSNELEAWLRHGNVNDANAERTATEQNSPIRPQIFHSPDQVWVSSADTEVLPKSDGQKSQSWKELTFPALLGCLYATLYVLAFFLEIAYRYDHLGMRGRQLAALVWVWVAICANLGITLDWLLTLRGRRGGLVCSMLLNVGGVLVLCAILWPSLPSIPVTEMTVQAQTGQAAYLKDALLYFLPLVVVFCLIPFHFVAALHREVGRGNNALVLDILLNRSPWEPVGGIFLKVWWLAVGLFATSLFAVASTNYLFDHLRPGPFMNLFMQVALAKVFLYFLFGLLCLLWYGQALARLKVLCGQEAHDATANPVVLG